MCMDNNDNNDYVWSYNECNFDNFTSAIPDEEIEMV